MTIRYKVIKRTNTDEIKALLHLFCDETGADDEARDILIQRLPNMHICAAMNETGIVGVGGYYVIGAKAIFDFMYVVSEYRNMSIAGRIHRIGLKHAKERGIGKAVVFVNPDRTHLYKKIGYKEVFIVLEKEI